MIQKFLSILALVIVCCVVASVAMQPIQPDTKQLIKEFTDAAYTNKIDKVELLLKSGIDINSKGPGGQTALQRAVSQGHEKMVAFLLNNGANPNIADAQQITPVIAVVMSYPSYKNFSGLESILKMLIARGANVNAINAGGQTALMLAIATELFPAAEMLLNAGATIWPKNIYHQAASDLIDERTIERLEQKMAAATTDQERKSVKREIAIALRIKGNETTVKEFLAAASANDQAKVEQLLHQGVLITSNDAQGDTALQYAAMQGHKDMVAFLLAKGIDIEHKDLLGMTALQVAARAGQSEMVAFLLEQGANSATLDKQQYTPLMTAIKGYSKHKNERAVSQIVEILLAKGDNINHQNKDGQTALIYASILDLKNIVQMLVDVGADTTIRDQLNHHAIDVTKSDSIKDILRNTDPATQNAKSEAYKELLAHAQQADAYLKQRDEARRIKIEEENRIRIAHEQELERKRKEEVQRMQEEARKEAELRLKILEEERQQAELRRQREFEEQQQADLLKLQQELIREREKEEERLRLLDLPHSLNRLEQALHDLQRGLSRRRIADNDGPVKRHQ